MYWRVRGKVKNAIDCLRVALHHSPYTYKDIPLTSLANVLHRAGLNNDALVAAYMALEISPTFVVIHFTCANIHAARVLNSPCRTRAQSHHVLLFPAG